MHKFFKGTDIIIGSSSGIVLAFCIGMLNYTPNYYHGSSSSYFESGAEAVVGLFGFMAISIVCTAGIALIVWFPAIFLLGTVVRKIFELFIWIIGLITGNKSKPSAPVNESTSSPSVFRPKEQALTIEEAEQVAKQNIDRSTNNTFFDSNNLAAVIGYISSAKATGVMSNEVIRTNLKSGGWSDEIIDDGFRHLASIGL